MVYALFWIAYAVGMAWDGMRRRWTRMVHGDTSLDMDSRWSGWYWRISRTQKPTLDKYRAIHYFRLAQALSSDPDGDTLAEASSWEILRELVRRKMNQYAQKSKAPIKYMLKWLVGIIAALIGAYVSHRMGWT